MSKLKELSKTNEAMKKRLMDEGKAAFAEHFETFFKKNTQVESLRWTQYTPYFNDGEDCHFGVGDTMVKVEGLKGEEYYDGYVQEYEIDNLTLKKAVLDLSKELSNMEEVCLMAFGDHKEITAYPNGKITVIDYDHE